MIALTLASSSVDVALIRFSSTNDHWTLPLCQGAQVKQVIRSTQPASSSLFAAVDNNAAPTHACPAARFGHSFFPDIVCKSRMISDRSAMVETQLHFLLFDTQYLPQNDHTHETAFEQISVSPVPVSGADRLDE